MHDRTRNLGHDRTPLDHLIGRKVIVGQMASPRLEVDDRVADRALAEPVPRQHLERIGNAGIAEGSARLDQLTIGGKQRPGRFRCGEDRRDHRGQVVLERRDLDPVSGRSHRSAHQFNERDRAETVGEHFGSAAVS